MLTYRLSIFTKFGMSIRAGNYMRKLFLSLANRSIIEYKEQLKRNGVVQMSTFATSAESINVISKYPESSKDIIHPYNREAYILVEFQ